MEDKSPHDRDKPQGTRGCEGNLALSLVVHLRINRPLRYGASGLRLQNGLLRAGLRRRQFL